MLAPWATPGHKDYVAPEPRRTVLRGSDLPERFGPPETVQTITIGPWSTTYGRRNFGDCKLGRKDRAARLAQLADRIAAHPGGTLPDKFSDPADLQAFYRMMNRKEVTHALVFQPHGELTLVKMRAAGCPVLIIHDTTELDYTGLTSLADELGQIGNGGGRGWLCHNSLAVNADTGEVLGLVGQILYRRPDRPKGETHTQRRRRADRESSLWTRGSEAVGPAPDGSLWVDVCDRGADVFEYMAGREKAGRRFLVRAAQDRNIRVLQEGETRNAKLFAHVRGLPAPGRRTVEAPAGPGRKGRKAEVTVAAGPLTVTPTKGTTGGTPQALWAVCVREPKPPAGGTAVEWILLSNVPTAGLAAAERLVSWYERRWIIEELHQAMKTGCGVETMQFTTAAAMQPAIAVLSVTAVCGCGCGTHRVGRRRATGPRRSRWIRKWCGCRPRGAAGTPAGR